MVACLLHDIARAPAVAGIPYDGAREHHGEAGARWLVPRVGERVAWLAEQHVPAKRYLVATDAGYRAQLSEVSARTLAAQGGAMETSAEVERFRAHPDWERAVALRRIDDRGKVRRPGERRRSSSYRDDAARGGRRRALAPSPAPRCVGARRAPSRGYALPRAFHVDR